MPEADHRDPGGARIRVVVVDDHAGVRSGAISAIGADPGFSVVGEASNGPDALSVVAGARPDVVLLDLSMPGMDGVETALALAEAAPRPAVVVFTGWADRTRLAAVRRAGVSSAVLKDAPAGELLAALRAAALEGPAPVRPAEAGRLARSSRPRVLLAAAAAVGLVAAGVAVGFDHAVGGSRPSRLDQVEATLGQLLTDVRRGDRAGVERDASVLRVRLAALNGAERAAVAPAAVSALSAADAAARAIPVTTLPAPGPPQPGPVAVLPPHPAPVTTQPPPPPTPTTSAPSPSTTVHNDDGDRRETTSTLGSDGDGRDTSSGDSSGGS